MIVTLVAMSLAAEGCRALDTGLPRPLVGWTRAGATLDTGHAVTLPARQGRATTSLRIRKQGLFGIAADRDGWIDVAPSGGRPLRMASEGRGPSCSTVRKIVRYRLRPGTYRVSVDRLRAERVRLMLVHLGAR
jgi:hypothetical protein